MTQGLEHDNELRVSPVLILLRRNFFFIQISY